MSKERESRIKSFLISLPFCSFFYFLGIFSIYDLSLIVEGDKG